MKVSWRPQLLRYNTVQPCRYYTVCSFLILISFSLPF